MKWSLLDLWCCETIPSSLHLYCVKTVTVKLRIYLAHIGIYSGMEGFKFQYSLDSFSLGTSSMNSNVRGPGEDEVPKKTL